MNRWAVFILPEGALRTRMDALKDRVAQVAPDAPYGRHPAHSSLIATPMNDSAAWPEHLAAAVSQADPFRLEVSGPIVFYDDALTGGHTLAWRVRRSAPLVALQQRVADAMRPWVDRSALPPLPPALAHEPYLSSYAAYGFPFVGAHWLPHFTIASPRVPRTHRLVTEFAAEKVRFTMTVRNVSLWRVEGEAHHPIRSLPLKEHTHDTPR